jgi:site-specific recombinase
MPDNTSGSAIKEFIRFLCALRKLNPVDFNEQVKRYFDDPLHNNRAYKQKFSENTSAIFFATSLTDAGVNSNLGFFPELKQCLKHRILPPVNEANFFSNLVAESFQKKEDYLLLDKLSTENWQRLTEIVSSDQTTEHVLLSELDNALIILTHQYVSIGIDPYVIRKLPSADDNDSPFFDLNILMNEHIKQIGQIPVEEVFDALDECVAVFNYLRENRSTLGISLHLTFLIRRAEQHAQRIKLLLTIRAAKNRSERTALLKTLATKIVGAELHRDSIRYFISENTGLLANRVANQTSAKGGDYIGFTKNENKKLLLSAMGGGLVVVLLVYLKHYIHLLHLPLLPEGILFGLNYGIGFVFMHFAHLTLATKQPAMTASYIAESIEQKGLGKDARKELSVILAQIMRSQFISLIGNLLVVLPLCYLIAWGAIKLNDYHIYDRNIAEQALTGNHPLLSGSLFYAVFTGIFLTLAGLISGYYDNKVIFSAIPKRIMHHPLLRKRFSVKKLEKFALLVSNNMGAVIGNMALGLFLGLAGNFGKFIGIPFDIRHITISAGNFSTAVAQGYEYPTLFLAVVFGGVILIGIINIISSFMFSFLIACRSRYLTTRETWLVLVSMVGYIFKNPRILIFRKDQVL